MSDDKKKPAEKKAGEKKPGDGRMTPEKAKELGLDPFPYGGK